MSAHVVILGAGHAGGTAAALLRQYGHEGPITLIGDEPIAPYQRPPLSKAWLKGEADADSLALKPLAFYAENNIDFRPNVSATAIDRAAKTVALSTGAPVSYDILIIATGARAIVLPIEGADLEGVLFLRTAADAEKLKGALGPGKRLAVVGGGYIGLEFASMFLNFGSDVTMLQVEPTFLAREDEELAKAIEDDFAKRGLKLYKSVTTKFFEEKDGIVTTHAVIDGKEVAFASDEVLVATGRRPSVEG